MAQQTEPEAPRLRRYLVGWRCSECGRTESGFFDVFHFTTHVCRGIPREGKGLCNGLMDIVHDERPAVDRENLFSR